MTPPTLQALHEHAAALRKLARDLVGTNEADDVLQDAAVALLRRPESPVDNVLAWLRRVVRHLAGKRRRAAAIRLQHERAASSLRADESFVADGAEAVETLRWLGDRLAALPEPYRSTVMARYLRDERPTAIAARLGVPVRTVKTRLARGLAHLRRDGAARGGDWRMALATTFALPAANASARAAGLFSLGVLGMGAMTKAVLVVGAIVLLGLASLFVWPTTVRPEAAGTADAVRATAAAGKEERVAATSGDSSSAQRTAADPAGAPAALPRAGADEIVVHVVDAATDAPIEAFGLREHVAALVLGEKERPLLHVGFHRSGRVLVPASQFDGHGFVVEVASGDYLPSAWFTAKDAVEIAGERVVLVRLQRPRDVLVRVVRERTGEPVVGTRVELLRPYPASPEVTLRTIALPTERFRVQPNLDPMMVAFAGGFALQLASDITDAEGRVRLRGNPDEALALRLLGPGHTPVVRQPWRVDAEAPSEVVEVVVVGGVIEVHFRPLAAWTQLRAELPREASLWPGGDGCGVRLRHVGTGAQRPEGVTGAPYAPDERGIVRIDGLAAGTWAATFEYHFRSSSSEDDARPGTTGNAEVALPIVTNLGDGETRVLQLDLSGLGCGKLDATVTLAGRLVEEGYVHVDCVTGPGGRALQVGVHGFHFGRDAHVLAQLPPGRFFASLHDSANDLIPLGEFTITTATTTRVDLIPDLAPLTVRVLQPDGTAAAGTLWLQRTGWHTGGSTNPTGEIVFPNVLRGDRVEAVFRRVTGTTPHGMPAFGPPVQLGIVHAAGDGAVVELRLPPQ